MIEFNGLSIRYCSKCDADPAGDLHRYNMTRNDIDNLNKLLIREKNFWRKVYRHEIVVKSIDELKSK